MGKDYGIWVMLSYDEALCSCCGYNRNTPFESTAEAKERWDELPPYCEMCGADLMSFDENEMEARSIMKEYKDFAQSIVIYAMSEADKRGLDVAEALSAVTSKAAETAAFLWKSQADTLEKCEV